MTTETLLITGPVNARLWLLIFLQTCPHICGGREAKPQYSFEDALNICYIGLYTWFVNQRVGNYACIMFQFIF